MKLYIRGRGQLAAAIKTCCERHFTLVDMAGDEPDIFWLCADTPVDTLDESNVEAVLDDVRPVLAVLPVTTLVLVSSQLPVGTVAILEGEFPELAFACSPENIRVAHGVSDFERQARVVVGIREKIRPSDLAKLKVLFAPFTNNLIFVSTETAEFVKHALNGFLALSIAYINEISTLCDKTGANVDDVARCVKLDDRVGTKARLNPGAPYSGGTLARDVYTMTKLGGKLTPLISAIKPSNDRAVR